MFVASSPSDLARAFAAAVEAAPDAVALVEGDEVHSYARLSGQVGALAALVREHVRQPGGTRIGLHLPHGIPAAAGQLAVAAVGACSVPLDPDYPAARLALMTEIAELDLVLTTDLTSGQARQVTVPPPAELPQQAWDPPVPDPDRAAYLLFTSGSTGRPKAVVHTHRSVLAGIRNHIAGLRIAPGDRLSLVTSFSYDMAVSDLYGALLSGAAVVPLDLRRLGVAAVAAGVRDQGVTVFHSTPTVFRLLIDEAGGVRDGAAAVRTVLLGGEPATWDDVRRARTTFGPRCEVVNGFGFTEASFVTHHHIPGDAPLGTEPTLPIGRPLPGVDLRVENADESGLGQLAVAGPMVARGYWNDPAETAARFAHGLLTYRSGDRIRRRGDGVLHHHGRTDRQVKVRGVRVELDEVQHELERLPAVARAVVIQTAPGAELEAHAQLSTGQRCSVAELRAALAAVLPDAFVPGRWYLHAALPLTESGKVDVRALPQAVVAQTGSTEKTRTVTPAQRRVLQAWTHEIGDPGGLDVGFFDAGGSSLDLLRVHRALTGPGPGPTPADLMGAGTVRAMASLLTGHAGAGPAGTSQPPGDATRAAREALQERRRRRRRTRAGEDGPAREPA